MPRRKPRGSALVKISKSAFDRGTRGKRCRLAGVSEGGSTFVCGKRAYAMIHDGSRYGYYRLTGRNAMYASYQEKQRRGR